MHQTPLLLAISLNKLDMVRAILKASASAKVDLNVKDKEGNTVLHLAMQQPFEPSVKLLLSPFPNRRLSFPC